MKPASTASTSATPTDNKLKVKLLTLNGLPFVMSSRICCIPASSSISLFADILWKVFQSPVLGAVKFVLELFLSKVMLNVPFETSEARVAATE